MLRAGYEVYIGTLRNKEVDFIATRNDRIIYVQSTYILTDEETVNWEYTPLEMIADNYEKMVVSIDDIQWPLRNGIRHVQAWNLAEVIK